MTKENLTGIIETLISNQEKATRQLPRGLILAYTPGSVNSGTFRFTCSRKGVSPSNKEMEIVERDLKTALKGRKRPFVHMQCQPFLKKRGETAVFQYHLWEWKELVQESLL